MNRKTSASSSRLDKGSKYSNLYQLSYVRYEDYRGSRVWVNSFYSYLRSGIKIYRDGPYYCYSGGAHHYHEIHGMLKVKIMMLVAKYHFDRAIGMAVKAARVVRYGTTRYIRSMNNGVIEMWSVFTLKVGLRKPTLMEQIFGGVK